MLGETLRGTGCFLESMVGEGRYAGRQACLGKDNEVRTCLEPWEKVGLAIVELERDGLYLWKSPGESRGAKASRHGVGNCSLGDVATIAHIPWNGLPGEE